MRNIGGTMNFQFVLTWGLWESFFSLRSADVITALDLSGAKDVDY